MWSIKVHPTLLEATFLVVVVVLVAFVVVVVVVVDHPIGTEKIKIVRSQNYIRYYNIAYT